MSTKAQQGNKPKHLLGAHMSIAGGLHNAITVGEEAGCNCVQVFVKNQRQWKAPPLTEEAALQFREAWKQSSIESVIAHAGYLINLGSKSDETRDKGIEALCDELLRCEALNIPGLVLHPGSHGGDGVTKGIRRIVSGLNTVHEEVGDLSTAILLETTAGQGTSIGCDFEHLERILDSVNEPDRIGICLDTCHLFAAGYDISEPANYEEIIESLDSAVGVSRVSCIHFNDAMKECGSRIDRHAHIGKGHIGDAGFSHFLNDMRFAKVPMILETPKGEESSDQNMDIVNLKRLRSLIQ